MNTPDFSNFSTRDVADIALQRTATLIKLPKFGSPSYRTWKRGMNAVLMMESILRRREILGEAWKFAVQEWQTFSQFIPEGSRLCDIGCGHALISLAAAKDGMGEITLVDIERTSEQHHEFADKGAGYASLEKAAAFLRANGFEGRLETCNPTSAPLPDGPYDAVISIISAGFHYPITEYADYARKTLSDGGVLIFDRRKGTDTERDLATFKSVEVIGEFQAHERILARI